MTVFLAAALLLAAEYRTPAGTETPARRPGAVSVLPGGRMIEPLGRQFTTGPGSFGLAISPDGKKIVTSDTGPFRSSLTIIENSDGSWRTRSIAATKRDPGDDDKAPSDDEEFSGFFQGLAFDNDREIWASEGNSGKVRLIDLGSGKGRATLNLNAAGFRDSYAGDLAFDRNRALLYVVDQANFRVAIFDTRRRLLISNVRVGRLPFAITLAPDGRRAYVTNLGMFEYTSLPGVQTNTVRATGLPFPAFGFPSAEASAGAIRQNAIGNPVEVPGLGPPVLLESNSLAVINANVPARAFVEKLIPTGTAHGAGSEGGSSPSGVLATEQTIYVTNANQDTITAIDAKTLEREGDIALRIAGLESYRGLVPMGLAIDAGRGWLLVAEAGINAIGVVDFVTRRLIGHIPAAWCPTRVALRGDALYIANAKGHGTGPNATMFAPMERGSQAELRRGAVTMFALPRPQDLAGLTRRVRELNGFDERKSGPISIPTELKHAVIIVKEDRTFDEVLGDLEKASGVEVRSAPELARYGRRGVVQQNPGELHSRITSKYINVTPNHHAMADRWAFSDNFYADSEAGVDGHHWLVGSYPNAWTESSRIAAYGGLKDFRFPTTAPGRLSFAKSSSSVHPEGILEAGTLWHHLSRHGISFRNFGEGFALAGVQQGPGEMPTGARFLTNVPMPSSLYENTSRVYPQQNTNIPDQYRAFQFIQEISQMETLPRLLFIHLPNDRTAKPRPEDGYPFVASYVADNDYALGRIMEALSSRPEWKTMTVFVTEDAAQGGVDHIDTHRTVLLVAGPYVKKNYVSRNNSSFPGILKTVFRILGVPPLNLYDAAATDLADCFTDQPDFLGYRALLPAREIFDPKAVKDPIDPPPSDSTDDARGPRHLKKR